MSYRKLLIPVDFSPCSTEAYRTGLSLARQFGAEVIVLHVTDSRILAVLEDLGGPSEDAKRAFEKKARLEFRSFLSKLPSDIKIRKVLASGIPFQEIVKVTRLENAELIIMGRSGGTGELEKIFFGGTAEKVIRLAPCAVLTVPVTQQGPGGAG